MSIKSQGSSIKDRPKMFNLKKLDFNIHIIKDLDHVYNGSLQYSV